MKVDQLIKLFLRSWWLLTICTLTGYWLSTTYDVKQSVVYSTTGAFELTLRDPAADMFREEYRASIRYRQMMLNKSLGIHDLSPTGACCVEAVTSSPERGSELILEFFENSLRAAQENMYERVYLYDRGNQLLLQKLEAGPVYITKERARIIITTDRKPLLKVVVSGAGLLVGMLLSLIVFWVRQRKK